MIRCEMGRPRCRKKAVALILLKGMKPAHGLEDLVQEDDLFACCADHANEVLYGRNFLASSRVGLSEALLQGYGVVMKREPPARQATHLITRPLSRPVLGASAGPGGWTWTGRPMIATGLGSITPGDERTRA